MLLVGLALGAGFIFPTDFEARTAPVPVSLYVQEKRAELSKVLPPDDTDLLSDGLRTLERRDFETALKILERMEPDGGAQKALAWSIAATDGLHVSKSTLEKLRSEFASWPMQARMRVNYERAFLNTRPGPAAVIEEFERNKPESNLALTALARAYLKSGDTKAAEALIRDWWPEARLSTRQQAKYAAAFKEQLRASDHKLRMDQLLYDGKTKLALRLSSLAKAESLAKGRAAVANGRSDAAGALGKVHESWSEDAGYHFSKVHHARRKGRYETAATLLRTAPHHPEVLIDPDRWWVERRIVSREMLERGKPSQAYVLAAAHSATGRAAITDAEFHAGWFALRFLEKPKTAEQHFSAVEEVATTPISRSRALYWLGRSADADERLEDAKAYYEKAAEYPGTFYGQLAHEHLGRTKLEFRQPSITAEDRRKFGENPLVQAIMAFEEAGDDRRAGALYRHLAKNLSDPAQLGLLALRLEVQGKPHAVLQIGKLAFNRGVQVEQLAFPTGAIPQDKVSTSSNLAMMYAIARQESAFRIDAVSPVGAMGLLQVMPRTAKAMAKGLDLPYSKSALLKDPALNATIGAAYFEEQLDRWNGSFVLTLAAYNAGPKRVQDWLKRFGDPRGKSTEEIVDWIESIPFPETRNYVMRVMEGYQVYQTRLQQSPLKLAEDLAVGG